MDDTQIQPVAAENKSSVNKYLVIALIFMTIVVLALLGLLAFKLIDDKQKSDDKKTEEINNKDSDTDNNSTDSDENVDKVDDKDDDTKTDSTDDEKPEVKYDYDKNGIKFNETTAFKIMTAANYLNSTSLVEVGTGKPNKCYTLGFKQKTSAITDIKKFAADYFSSPSYSAIADSTLESKYKIDAKETITVGSQGIGQKYTIFTRQSTGKYLIIEVSQFVPEGGGDDVYASCQAKYSETDISKFLQGVDLE